MRGQKVRQLFLERCFAEPFGVLGQMGEQILKIRQATTESSRWPACRRHFRSAVACGLIAVALLLGGCAAWGRPLASEPPVAEDKAGFSGLRPAGKQGQALGLDERSREIERSLGVH